jgi:hypothetical protein
MTTNVPISANWQGVLASDIIPGDTAWVLASIGLVFIMTPVCLPFPYTSAIPSPSLSLSSPLGLPFPYTPPPQKYIREICEVAFQQLLKHLHLCRFFETDFWPS